MVLTSEDLENRYREWFDSKKSWLCANSSRVDDVLKYLLLDGIITPMEKKQIESDGRLTIQFAVIYHSILKAGVSKINYVIDVMRKSELEDVREEFMRFKEQNIPERGIVNQMLTNMSLNEINYSYQTWVQSKMNFFCENTTRLDEILTLLVSRNLIDLLQKHQIETVKAKGYAQQFFLVYDVIKQLGVEHLDCVIDVLCKANQVDVLEEFMKFRAENSLKIATASTTQIRTKHDKPLVNPTRAKPIRMEVDDTIDFVHNMQPLEIVVRQSIQYCGKDNDAYKMQSSPRGFALIINNIKFDDPMRNRTGAAEKDTEYTTKLLQQLNYRVILKENVRSSDLPEILKSFKKKFEDNSVDSCIVVLMSHGGNNTLEMADGEYAHAWQDIIYKFDNNSCPQLVGKPKIFIIQACQNFAEQKRTGHDGPPMRSRPTVTVSDMLICFSTIPGHVSHRDKFLGSWYIYCLSKVFMENAFEMEITKMLQKIANETMMNVKSEDDQLQVSTYQPILFRDFYFNPGL